MVRSVKMGFVFLILVREMRNAHQVSIARMGNADHHHLVKRMLIVSMVRSVNLKYVLMYVRLKMIAQRKKSVSVYRMHHASV